MLNLWLWIPGFGLLGLESWVWILGFGVLGLDSWVCIHGFGFLVLDIWVWIHGSGFLFRDPVFGFLLWIPGLGVLGLESWVRSAGPVKGTGVCLLGELGSETHFNSQAFHKLSRALPVRSMWWGGLEEIPSILHTRLPQQDPR